MLRRLACVMGLLGLLACAPAFAQAYPSKPLHIVVPYAPGGVMDVMARAVAVPLAEILGQQVLIENRTGGGGNIGTDYVARSAPDGYTILILADTNTIAPALYSKLNHDPDKDFAPVTLLVTGPHIIVAHPSVPASNVRELIALARANPDKYAYASPGNGTAQHLGAEVFKSMAGGLRITHVPYKGGGQAISDVVGGQVPLGFLGLAPVLQHIRVGKLKAIAVTSRKRVALLPEVPTVDESGLPGFETLQWYGPVAPAGTTDAVIATLHGAFTRAAQTAFFRERVGAIGVDVSPPNSPEEFRRFIRNDIQRWPPVVKATGARVD